MSMPMPGRGPAVTASTYPVWGWGGPGEEPDPAALEALAPVAQALLGFGLQAPERPARLRPLPTPRLAAPAPLAAIASQELLDRARHGLGRAYVDLIRGVRGRIDHPPDLVLRPRTEAEVAAVLDWCGQAQAAVVPFGGGTSVVGGLEAAVGDRFAGVVALDLGALAGVAEVDPIGRAARVLAGTTGPALEAALGRHGLSFRFFPQSFERSTVGGWLATRAAGHFATGPTHIDDLVEAVRLVTPAGVWASRRLPASGAGPSPDRFALGSEGTLGVITEAWLRVRPRPESRTGTVAAFESFSAGAEAVRAIVQAGLAPATCRLTDTTEAALTGTLAGGEAVLLVGFETAGGPPPDVELATAATLARDAGGRLVPEQAGAAAADAWRRSFRRAPYLREQLVLLGVLAETFETAITWDRLEELVARVAEATRAALAQACGGGAVTCRLTHAYPDGAAPYFTVLAPARRGGELSQWAEVKAAAAEAVLAAGAPSPTTTGSAASTGPGTSGSDRGRSGWPWPPPRPPSTRPGCSTQESSYPPDPAGPPAGSVQHHRNAPGAVGDRAALEADLPVDVVGRAGKALDVLRVEGRLPVRVPGSVGRHRGRWDREEQGGTARVAVDQQGHLVGGLDLGADEDVALLGVDRRALGVDVDHRPGLQRGVGNRGERDALGVEGLVRGRRDGQRQGRYQGGHGNDAEHSTGGWHGDLLTVSDRSGSQEP
jgi:alkyldihydroxyacetonephosphate synthase